MNKKNKKPNNIGTGMHTISYIGQQYIDCDYLPPLTLRQIVENQEKHQFLIPRSSEDQEYLIKLASLVSKNIPEPIILEKCKEFFSNSGYDSYFSSNEGDKLNILCYCHNCESKFPLRNIKWIDFSEEEEPILHSDQETLEDLHWILTEGGYSQNESVDAAVAQIIKKSVHNKDSDIFYPHGEDYDKYHGLKPMCAKFPICPSPFSYFDLQLKNEQYNLEDHKKGKYDY